MTASETLYLTKIKHDTNGNPRYVVHFFSLSTQAEYDAPTRAPWDHSNPQALTLSEKYASACKRANSIGGRKFHTKSYGGGIVFQSYSLPELMSSINRATGRNFTSYEVSR